MSGLYLCRELMLPHKAQTTSVYERAWEQEPIEYTLGAKLTDRASQFNQAMFGIYQRAKREAKYNATIFLQMLNDKGGLQTAKTLINATKPSAGYTALYERGRLDLTVEAVVVENPEWHPLFEPEELKKAQKRLRSYEYIPKTMTPPPKA